MKKFTADVLLIGGWISKCTTNEQIRNMENFYRTIISVGWYPEVDNDSILDGLDHLDKMISAQDFKIQNKS